jgi:SHS2 domain-containing protein
VATTFQVLFKCKNKSLYFRRSALSELQAEAALALTNCQSLASRKLEAEKRRREFEDAQALRVLVKPLSLNLLRFQSEKVSKIVKVNDESSI